MVEAQPLMRNITTVKTQNLCRLRNLDECMAKILYVFAIRIVLAVSKISFYFVDSQYTQEILHQHFLKDRREIAAMEAPG